MAYLNVTPMLEAMRARPYEFEMQGSYFHHIPSDHRVQFDLWGNARVHAQCDCHMLDISREQSGELKTALAVWKAYFWQPRLEAIAAEKRAAKINRQFASHFRPPGLFRRFLNRMRHDVAPPLPEGLMGEPIEAAAERPEPGLQHACRVHETATL